MSYVGLTENKLQCLVFMSLIVLELKGPEEEQFIVVFDLFIGFADS